MFTITCIDHIVIRTTNMDKMVHFYCDILGCHIEKEQEKLGLMHLRAGDNLIDLLATDNPVDHTNQNVEHFCLRIQPFNFEKLDTYFQKNNINIARYGERYGAKGIGYSFYLHDPEGNEIELCEAKP